jgi:hypothetical protein
MCYFTSLLQDHCCGSELETRAGDSLETHLAPSTAADRLALVRFFPRRQPRANLRPREKMMLTCDTSQLASTLSPNDGVVLVTQYWRGLSYAQPNSEFI